MNELGDALGTKLIDPQTLENIINRTEHLINNPPMMLCVNVVLNDQSALKYAIAKDVIMRCANIAEADADWYLLMRGVEEELKKLSVLGVVDQNEIQG